MENAERVGPGSGIGSSNRRNHTEAGRKGRPQTDRGNLSNLRVGGVRRTGPTALKVLFEKLLQ